MNNTDPYWCTTCGKSITKERAKIIEECEVCEQWWLENPPFGGPYEDSRTS